MIKTDEKSNAQSWELEVTCKNKDYLNAVVKAILKYGMMDFEVKCVDVSSDEEGFDGNYVVLICCAWFSNLKDIAEDLAKIEKRLDKLKNHD